MKQFSWLPVVGLVGWLAMAPTVQAQARPYIGFGYPAGGKQGTTFQIQVGGQGLDDVDKVFVTGTGVRARVVEYHRRLGPQEMTLLREQLGELRKGGLESKTNSAAVEAAQVLKARIEKRMAEYVNRPACASIANIALIEVTMASDAQPGERELRLGTPSGISNPLVFHVGQFPEVSRRPMLTCEVQVLGKEELALRKRPAGERELLINLPCTVNGQIASGEVDRYRFSARKGQQLVIAVLARQLIPYIADAVPGWLQPVLRLHDPAGKEVAYVDDFRFKPDPIIFYKVPGDGEYVFSIHDSIYRGREDFVYRITVGELPYATSIFPMGGRVDEPVSIKVKGVNLGAADLVPQPRNLEPGIYPLAPAREGFVLNRMPFAVDTLPEAREQESNDTQLSAQKVTLPVIINGRVDQPDDADVFQFSGRAGEKVVAEVIARRLDSPLDSLLKLTDMNGTVLAFNDDREDLGAGVNTHHADSHLMFTLPADGIYFVHVADTARGGGEEFGYRLRISPPRPDFALRVVPSSVALRGRSSATVSVHAIRKDGFGEPIQVSFKNPPKGFTSSTVTLSGTQQVAQVTLSTTWAPAKDPICFNASVQGSAKVQSREIIHEAVPGEDRMQAFLWRHLVPARELKVMVFNPAHKPDPKRTPAFPSTLVAKARAVAAGVAAEPPKFTKRQVAGRLRDLRLLFEEGLLTNEFYVLRVAECEALD